MFFFFSFSFSHTGDVFRNIFAHSTTTLLASSVSLEGSIPFPFYNFLPTYCCKTILNLFFFCQMIFFSNYFSYKLGLHSCWSSPTDWFYSDLFFSVCSSSNTERRLPSIILDILFLFATARCTKLLAAGVACLFFIFSHYWWREKVMSKVWNGLFTRFIGCCCFCCCCSWSRLAAVGLQSCSVRLPWWISWGLTWSLLEPTTVCVDWISFHGTYKQTSMNFDFILYWLYWWTEWVLFSV